MFSSFSNSAYGLKRYNTQQIPPPTLNPNGWLNSTLPNDCGIKVHYTFDNTDVDTINGYNGTALNNPFDNTQSKFGTYSLRGDGLSNGRNTVEPAFLLPVNIPFNTSLGCSFTMWIYPQYQNINQMIVEFGIDSYLMMTSSYQLRYGTSTSSYTASLTPDVWSFIVITVKSTGEYNIYVNNTNVKAETKSTSKIDNLNAVSFLDGITRTGHMNSLSYFSDFYCYNSIITEHPDWTGI